MDTADPSRAPLARRSCHGASNRRSGMENAETEISRPRRGWQEMVGGRIGAC